MSCTIAGQTFDGCTGVPQSPAGSGEIVIGADGTDAMLLLPATMQTASLRVWRIQQGASSSGLAGQAGKDISVNVPGYSGPCVLIPPVRETVQAVLAGGMLQYLLTVECQVVAL